MSKAHARPKDSKRGGPPIDGGVIFIPGRKGLIELSRHRPNAIKEVYVADNLQASSEFAASLAALEGRGVRIRREPKQALDERLPGMNHQGVIAKVSGREAVPAEELLRNAKQVGKNAVILVVDEVSDPHNIGALFRVADACGVVGLVLTKSHTAAVTATVRKVSAGSTEFVPYSFVTNLQRFLDSAKSAGMWIIGSALGDGSKDIFQTELPGPMAVVLGSEGQGLRRLTKDMCDILVEIPMHGAIQSLNVSHAAAVMLYEICRRRSESSK